VSAAFWLSSFISAVVVWQCLPFLSESLGPDAAPLAVSYWAAGILLIGMVDLWRRPPTGKGGK
jgi:hypothetical protein